MNIKVSTKFCRQLLAVSSLSALGLAALTGQTHAAPKDYDAKRCVNIGNALESPPDGSWGGPLVTDEFKLIKKAGFDTVRVPAKFSGYTGEGPAYIIDEAFMARVEEAVDAALDEGLNVVLTLHHFDEIMQEPRENAAKLIAMWRQIATRFADKPGDLWFEVLNEPSFELKGKLMRAIQSASVFAIRETNPDRIVIIGGEDWSSIRSLSSNIAPPDENTVYTFHYYDPFDFTHQRAAWLNESMPKGRRRWGSQEDQQQVKTDAETAGLFAKSIERPVFLGEFGVYDVVRNSDRTAYAGAVRREMEKQGIGWCLWAFANTFPIYDREDNDWDEDMLEALGLDAGDN